VRIPTRTYTLRDIFTELQINKCSAVAEMVDRLATIEMGRKVGAVLLGVELGPHLTQCSRAEAHLRTKWYLDPSNRLATTNNG